MKILLINGSPKREQSDTMRLTRSFLDGMRDALPVGVQTICPIDRVIEPCRGCFACMRGGGCVCQDDMKQILADIPCPAICCCSAFRSTATACLRRSRG
ncbi:MAG: NAD(P)H-dependent oxidoreductase [Eubacteriales bacterium]|nr:NAD(P)H-dependent oxidoreductase [Eubacteriales bacterium]